MGTSGGTWSPLPANTLATFKALRKQCAEDLQTAYSDAHTNWSKESKKLAAMGRALEDLNEAWYADATEVHAGNTPEGQVIRSSVPTTYTPPPDKKTTPPTTPTSPA